MSPTYLVFGARGGEVPLQQVRHLLVGGLGDGGPDPPAEPDAGEAVLGHHPRDALVVDPLLGWGAVVELGGDPRGAVGLVGLVHGPDPLRELLVGSWPFRPRRCGGVPGVERGPVDLDDLTQPLHLEGVSVVGDELEAAHQFVSPAKYLAAWRRIFFSVSIFAFSARSAAFSASSRATFSAWVSGLPAGVLRAADRGSRRTRAERLDPLRQRASGDPEIVGDAPQRGTGGGLVQINGLPTELVGVVLPGHGQDLLASPARCWIQRVQDQGSSPDGSG